MSVPGSSSAAIDIGRTLEVVLTERVLKQKAEQSKLLRNSRAHRLGQVWAASGKTLQIFVDYAEFSKSGDGQGKWWGSYIGGYLLQN